MSVDKIEQKLLSLLSPDTATSVRFLSERLYVSESTARRYINTLAERGLVIRTHGGCMPSGLALDSNTPMYIRFSSDQEEKTRLVRVR
jgi:DeoR/GlpR family transcriptional regulator of sugar metabolism